MIPTYPRDASVYPEVSGYQAGLMADARIRTKPSRSDGRGRAALWPLIAICTGYFVIILDTTVVSVALPSLSRGLGASTTELQWIVDAYSLVFAALLLSAGALADRRGARAVFIMGTGLFTVASAAGGLAASAGMLVAARMGSMVA
jgi:MFS transporter, DHA2 family, methylenomycin A resistance protein